MHLFKLLFIALFVIISTSFKSKTNELYQAECVSLETDGYIKLRIWDTRKGANYTSKQARKDAIHAILYSGIAASSSGCSTQPPFLNNIEEREAFKGIAKSFFAKNGQWSVFTRNATIETILPTHIGNKSWKVFQVSVSKNELRKDLEERKIIKSLSNGF